MDKPPTWKQRTFGRLGTSTPNAIFIRKKLIDDRSRWSLRRDPSTQQAVGLSLRIKALCAHGPCVPHVLPLPPYSYMFFVWIMFVHKNILSSLCYLCLENRLYRCAMCDETNKTRPHLYMFWRCLWNGSNLCGNLFSFCSNLCVFRLIVVTVYVHNNFCFVSTYMYECMIDFVCSIYILYV